MKNSKSGFKILSFGIEKVRPTQQDLAKERSLDPVSRCILWTLENLRQVLINDRIQDMQYECI